MALPSITIVDSDIDTLVQRARTPRPTPGNVQAPISGTYSAPYRSTQAPVGPVDYAPNPPGTNTTPGGVTTPVGVSGIVVLAVAAIAVYFLFIR